MGYIHISVLIKRADIKLRNVVKKTVVRKRLLKVCIKKSPPGKEGSISIVDYDLMK
jgi:hypothetical protein